MSTPTFPLPPTLLPPHLKGAYLDAPRALAAATKTPTFAEGISVKRATAAPVAAPVPAPATASAAAPAAAPVVESTPVSPPRSRPTTEQATTVVLSDAPPDAPQTAPPDSDVVEIELSPAEQVELEQMTVKQLKDYANDLSVSLVGVAKKKDIIKRIRAARD